LRSVRARKGGNELLKTIWEKNPLNMFRWIRSHGQQSPRYQQLSSLDSLLFRDVASPLSDQSLIATNSKEDSELRGSDQAFAEKEQRWLHQKASKKEK
jgi:hypothetical protein